MKVTDRIHTPKRLIAIVSVIVLVMSLALGLFLSQQSTLAATDPVYPDGTTTAGFANCTNTCGTNHHTEIDEASYDNADYINTGLAAAGGEVELYTMTSVAGTSTTVTAVDVKIYAYADGGCQGSGGNCDDLSVRISIDGAFDATTNTQTLTAADTEYTLSWTGTWTGDDDLQIEITRIVNGGGPAASRDDDVRIGRVMADVTYSTGPSQIAFSTAARTVTAGTCSGAGSVITVQLQNGSGTPTNPSGATVVRLTSNTGGTFTVYSDDTCSTTLTNGDISFSTAENSKNVYVIDTRKSNPTWTLTAAKQSGPDTLSSANQNLTVNAGTVTRLVTTLPGQTFTDGTGNSGSPTARTAGVGFTITSISATDNFFNVDETYTGAKTLVYAGPSNAPDTTAPSYTTAVSFTTGQSTTTLTTTLFNAETTTITVTDGGSYGFASSSVTTNPGSASADTSDSTVTGSATVATGSPLTVTITMRDTWRNPISGIPAADFNISGTGSPTVNDPSAATNASGQTTGDLTWAGTGSFTVSVEIVNTTLVQNDGSTADADGFLDNTHAVTVTAASPNSSTIQGGTIIQGGTTIQ